MNAQTPVENVDRRDQIVRYDRVIAASDGNWIFAGMHQGWYPAQTLLVGRNEMGQVLWEQPNAGVVDVWNLIGTTNCFVYSGPDFGCSLPSPGHRLVYRTNDGEHQWTVGLELITPVSIDVDQNDLIAMIGEVHEEGLPPQVLILDGAGEEHSQWELPWQQPRAIRWALNGTVLTLFDDAIASWTDDGIPIQNSMISPGALDLAVIAAGDIRVLYEDRVVRFGSDLAAIDSVMLSTDSAARWMEFAEGTLWITCEEDFASVHPVDGLSATFSNQPIDSLHITGTAVRDGMIMTAGTAYVDERSSGVMRSFTTEGLVAEHDDDVAISIANVDTLFVTTSAPAFPNMMTLHAQVTLMVENKGTNVLETVLLNTQRTVGYCGADFGANAYGDTLQLAPGATALIQMPLITYWPVDVALGESLTIERCYVALAPNNKVDREPFDNSTCYTFEVLHTGLATTEAFGGALVAPVPFGDRFSIVLGAPPVKPAVISIHDSSGRLFLERTWPAGQIHMDLDATVLPPGVLVLKMIDADQQISRQLVRLP
jgi:hypothetical protein